MKNILTVFLAFMLSSCALFPVKHTKQEQYLDSKMICDSNCQITILERKYLRSKHGKSDKETRMKNYEAYTQEMHRMGILLSWYEKKYYKTFNWKECKRCKPQ